MQNNGNINAYPKCPPTYTCLPLSTSPISRHARLHCKPRQLSFSLAPLRSGPCRAPKESRFTATKRLSIIACFVASMKSELQPLPPTPSIIPARAAAKAQVLPHPRLPSLRYSPQTTTTPPRVLLYPSLPLPSFSNHLASALILCKSSKEDPFASPVMPGHLLR